LGDGLDITMFYRIGVDPANENNVIGGTQDNGSNILRDGLWFHIFGADGMEALVDHTDNDVVYCSSQFGEFYRFSQKGKQYEKRIAGTGLTERGGWITPFVMHPDNNQILFAGYSEVFKSENRGDNWLKISSFSGSSQIQSLQVARTNPDYIYANVGEDLQVTKDGGATWYSIVDGLPANSITSIAVSENDEERIWVTTSGFDQKVFQSDNAGETWRNIGAGIPSAVHVNCIIHQKDSKDQLYIGTDIGVFEKDHFEETWTFYSDGLPGIIVRELEIHYGSGQLFAATFGRGAWKTDILQSIPIPFSLNSVNADNATIQEGDGVNFAVDARGEVRTYFWEFEGGVPASSTLENPFSYYSSEGQYDVKLTIEGILERETIIMEDFISVNKVLGIEDENRIFNVFPNPASEKITVSFDNPAKDYKLQLLDINGKVLLKETYERNAGNLEISLKDIEEGMYFLMIEDEAKQTVEKLLVK
ncbi:MAG: T9SS type A sorting domain-containing protein, partial [Cyclobacteriaceae bacterium]